MMIPGIGPIAASALVAEAGSGRQLTCGRDMVAWLGLVRKEHSTGGKTTLLGISKPGNRHLRGLLVNGAWSCVLHLDRRRDGLGEWLDGQARRSVIQFTACEARGN